MCPAANGGSEPKITDAARCMSGRLSSKAALKVAEIACPGLPLIDRTLITNLARKISNDYRTDHELAFAAPTEAFPKLDD